MGNKGQRGTDLTTFFQIQNLPAHSLNPPKLFAEPFTYICH